MHATVNTSLLNRTLSALNSRDEKVIATRSVGGGSINYTYKIETNYTCYFIKFNPHTEGEAMFAAEQAGLSLLRTNSGFTIPEVVTLVTEQGAAYLIMEFIDSAARRSGYWQLLGEQLAAMHRNTNAKFGLEADNFIGSLPQHNSFYDNWADFFRYNRMQPQLRWARDAGLMSGREVSEFEQALAQIIELMPIEPPALVHGDLWSGNLMVDTEGKPCLVDPAVYYGHREMDLAFSRMFGGFDREFYRVYHEVYPLEPGLEQRVDLFNLYPLLVHLNLFGRSYYGQIKSIISRFT